MDRKQKIKLLEAIRDGKITPDQITENKIHVIYEDDSSPGHYLIGDRQITEEEYLDYCKAIEAKNIALAGILEPDQIIIVTYGDRKERRVVSAPSS